MNVLSLVCTVRPSALTIPVVSVLENPNGFPMARAFCPTSRVARIAQRQWRQFVAFGIDLNEGDVVACVFADELGFVA